MRSVFRQLLQTAGLLGPVRRVRRWRSARHIDRDRRRRLAAFKKQYGRVLDARVLGPRPARRALVVTPKWPNLEGGLVLMKGLQEAGFAPVVLEKKPDIFGPYYRLAGIDAIHRWDEFSLVDATTDWMTPAAALLKSCGSIEDVTALRWEGVRVGLYAASTASRQKRVGSFNLEIPEVRKLLTQYLSRSIRAVNGAHAMLTAIRPDLVTFLDPENTPKGELFDSCLNNGIDAVVIDSAHRVNTLMLKRYNVNNRDDQLASLSARTWTTARSLPWSDARRAKLSEELFQGYSTGRWFGTSRTQFHTRLMDSGTVRRVLGLDPRKRTVFVFSHILWDAPFSWAQPLFPTYEEWLVETVRAACRNTLVNWVIKIHPANVGKRALEGYPVEPTETRVLAEQIGTLPEHVVLLPADSEISTYSVFDVMDCCVTVRGTIGIEAAARGIPVLTASRSRYSGRGFTIDSETRDQYLERLSLVQDLCGLSDTERDLAQRFAYGLFVLRPLKLESVTWEHGQLGYPPGESPAKIHVKESNGWREAADLSAFAAWVGGSKDEDFLAGDPVGHTSVSHEVQSP